MRRAIDLTRVDVKAITWLKKDECRFHLTSLAKTYNHRTRKSHAPDLQYINLMAFPIDSDNDKKLCPIRCLKMYLKHTQQLRIGHISLFIITCAPFSPAKKVTLSIWIKEIMAKAGIDITKFTPHSFRSASASWAYLMGVSLDSIMRKAGWAQESTFIRHYLKDIAAQPLQLVSPSAKKSVTPALPDISEGFHRKHARDIEAELQLAKSMKKFSRMWNEDTQGNSLTRISKLVAEFREAGKKKPPPDVFALAHESKLEVPESDCEQPMAELVPLTHQDVEEILPLPDQLGDLQITSAPSVSDQQVSEENIELLSKGTPFSPDIQSIASDQGVPDVPSCSDRSDSPVIPVLDVLRPKKKVNYIEEPIPPSGVGGSFV